MEQTVTTITRLMKLAKLKHNGHTVVVGGGISGLSFGYFLGTLRPDLKITILEKDNRVGGYIRSQSTEIEGKKPTILEKGPRTLRGVSTGTLLIADILHRTGNIGVINGVHMSSEGNKKYLMAKSRDGGDPHLLTVPGPGESMSTMFSFLGSSPGLQAIRGIFKDLFRFGKPDVYDPRKDLTVEEFFTRHFGKGLINEVGSALMYGIYACDVKNLSVRCVMPAMAELGEKSPSLIRHAIKAAYENNSKKKSTMEVLEREVEKNDDALAVVPLEEEVKEYVNEFSSRLNMVKLKGLLKKFPMLALSGGLETLTGVLRDNLPKNVEVILNDGVKSIENRGQRVAVHTINGSELECDHLRSTVSAKQLINAFKSKEITEILKDFQYTSVTVANVYIKKNVKQLRGFGFLIPKALFNKDKRLMGVIFDSDVESSAKGIFNKKNVQAVESNVKDDMSALAMDVHKSSLSDSLSDFTKVTFMFNINPETKESASESKLKQIVSEVFEMQFGVDLRAEDWFMEHQHLHSAIPMYDVEYLWRKQALIKQLEQEFDQRVSLGGMSFARGVGVPDCVLTSFQDALQLAK